MNYSELNSRDLIRMHKLSVFLLILMFFSASLSQAKLWKWVEAREYFLKNSVELKVEEKNLMAISEDYKSTRGAFFPEISAEFTAKQYDINGAGHAFDSTSEKYLDQGLYLKQNIFNGFYNTSSLEIAKLTRLEEENNYEIKKAELVNDLRESYINALYFKLKIEFAKSLLKQRADNVKILELNYQSGKEHKGTLMLIQAYYEEAKYDVLEAENSYQIAIGQLKQKLDLDSKEELDVEPFETDKDPALEEPQYKFMIDDLAEYQNTLIEEKKSESTITQSRSYMMPSLDFKAKVYQEGRGTDDINHQTKQWEVRFDLVIPLFSGGKDYYSVSSAKLTNESAKLNSVFMYRKLEEDLKTTWNDWRLSYENCKVQKAFLDSTIIRSTIARKKYSNGLISFDDWDSIEDKLVQRNKDYLSGLKAKWLNESAWNKLTVKAKNKI